MAVLSSAKHPNIVQAYCCMTDMVQALDGNDSVDSVLSVASQEAPGGAEGALLFLPLGAEEAGGPGGSPLIFNIVVMELCEHGTLQEALGRGAFAAHPAGGAEAEAGGGPDAAPAPAAAPATAPVTAPDLIMDIPGVLSVLLDVASALTYLHSMKLAHGMVKAENVLVRTDPLRSCGFIAKLGGFGS